MKTLKEMRDEVIEDLDFQDDDLVSNTDIDRWINKGIRKAHADIISIHEPYFLSYAEQIIDGTTDIYSYPSDIYANKFKSIVLVKSTFAGFPVYRIKDLAEATRIQLAYKNHVNTGGAMWVPLNTAASGRKIQLIPKPDSGTLKMWYIRNANILVNDTDVCDIDEFEDFPIAYAKYKALVKDNNPMSAEAKEEVNETRRLMLETLEEMVIDGNDNKLEADYSFYEGVSDGTI